MALSQADPLLASSLPTLPTRQGQGVVKEGHLGLDAWEEPSWLALGPLEGVTDILPVCFSQGFGHEGWTLPTQRTQVTAHCVFLAIGFSPSGSLPSLPLSANPC